MPEPDGPTGGPAADDPALAALLGPVLEPAFVVARADGPAAPRALHPFLRFDRVNDRVLQRVVVALDADDDFRGRVADAVGDDEDVVGRAAVLYLTRPEGWAEELAELLDVERSLLAERAARADEDRASAQLPQLEAALAAARAELTELERRLAEAVAERDAEQDRRRQAERAANEAAATVAELGEDRARAVKDLAEARQLAERRLAQLRSLEDASTRAASPSGEAADEATGSPRPDATAAELAAQAAADRDAALEALRDVARVVGRLTAEVGGVLDAAMGALGAPTPAAAPAVPAPAAAPPSDAPRSAMAPGPAPAARRVPVRLRQGAVEGTPEATRQLLGLDDVLVLVDGYNVSQTGWHHLGAADQRQALLAGLGDLRARTGADFHVVFDGDADGTRPAVSVALPVRVYFTVASEEADDAILRMVTEVPLERPVVVVSSDHRVRDGARRRGANVVSSADLLDAVRH